MGQFRIQFREIQTYSSTRTQKRPVFFERKRPSTDGVGGRARLLPPMGSLDRIEQMLVVAGVPEEVAQALAEVPESTDELVAQIFLAVDIDQSGAVDGLELLHSPIGGMLYGAVPRGVARPQPFKIAARAAHSAGAVQFPLPSPSPSAMPLRCCRCSCGRCSLARLSSCRSC